MSTTADPRFLIIDDHVDNRFLLTRTLGRKYPTAEIVECGDSATAVARAATQEIAAVISHRADLTDGIELIRQIRQVNPAVPIIMVSGYDRTREALAAGATRFLPYEEWLRIGSVVEEVLAAQPHAALISALTFALERRFVVQFSLLGERGAARVCEIEPHLLGTDAGRRPLLRGYGVVRGTPHPLRDGGWATFPLEKIGNVVVSERLFAPHPGDGSHDPDIVNVLVQIEGTASAFIPRRTAK